MRYLYITAYEFFVHYCVWLHLCTLQHVTSSLHLTIYLSITVYSKIFIHCNTCNEFSLNMAYCFGLIMRTIIKIIIIIKKYSDKPQIKIFIHVYVLM